MNIMIWVAFVQILGLASWIDGLNSVSLSKYGFSRFFVAERCGFQYCSLPCWWLRQACVNFVCMVVLFSGLLLLLTFCLCLEFNSIWIESSVEVLASILHYQRFHLQGAASYCLLRLIRGIADWLSREVGVKGVTTKLCSFKAFNFMPHVLAGCVVNPIRPLSIYLYITSVVKNLIGGL